MVSVLRLIRSVFAYTTFLFGTLLNSVLIFLVLKHTPKTMQVYSKILLQTCLNDLALLVVTLLFDGYMFVGNDGIEIWADGLLNIVSPNNPGLRGVQWLLFGVWCFLDYMSLFGCFAQFIYRYLTLNRDKSISSGQYFGMLAGISLLPLVYCVLLEYCYFPPPEHRFMQNKLATELLDLTNSSSAQPVVLAGFNNGTGFLMALGIWFICTACTIAYAIIIVLGWRMVVFVREHLKGASNNQSETLQHQKQITKTLIIQAIMPTFIYGSLFLSLFGLVFNFRLSGRWETVLQYYYNLSMIPMYFPSALNPVVSIAVIQDYRRAFLSLLRCRRPNKTSSSLNLHGRGTSNANAAHQIPKPHRNHIQQPFFQMASPFSSSSMPPPTSSNLPHHH